MEALRSSRVASRLVATRNAVRSGGQCPQSLDRDLAATSCAAAERAVLDPSQRLLDIPETALGSLHQHQHAVGIAIGGGVFVVEHVAAIPIGQRIDSLVAEGIDTSRNRLATLQEKFNEAYGGSWTTRTDWLFHALAHATKA